MLYIGAAKAEEFEWKNEGKQVHGWNLIRHILTMHKMYYCFYLLYVAEGLFCKTSAKL